MTRITLEKAKLVAKILCEDGRMCGAEVFGSIARKGEGNDLDLILLVQNRALVNEFIFETNLAIKEGPLSIQLQGEDSDFHLAYNFTYSQKILIKLLGDEFQNLLEQVFTILPVGPHGRGAPLDLIMLPHSWKSEIRILELGFPMKDPDFWRNLLREAVRIL